MQEQAITDRIRIASPCKADWESMAGDERVRFCQSCRKHVYNLSAMTPDAIAELIRFREGKLCARLYRRRDGTMLTANCSVGRRRQRRRDLLGLTIGALGIFAAYLGIAATSDKACNAPAATLSFIQRIQYGWREWLGFSQPTPMMGDIAVMGTVAPASPPTPPPNTTSAK